jgi:hypothetical protein
MQEGFATAAFSAKCLRWYGRGVGQHRATIRCGECEDCAGGRRGGLGLTDDRIEPIPEALGRVLASPDQVRVAPAHRSQVRFVVSHADAVEGVAVDQGHLDRHWPISSSLRAVPTALQSPANPPPRTRIRLVLIQAVPIQAVPKNA